MLHVHEVEPLASRTLDRYRLGRYYQRIEIVACSTAARTNIARIAGVDDQSVFLVTSPVDVDDAVARSGPAPLVTLAPNQCGQELVVGACALANVGKGVDQWLDVAMMLHGSDVTPPTRFVWVGAYGPETLALRAERGLDNDVEFAGETSNPYPALRSMDIFTLPSRADAFPLVVLEAMALGLPVVAFDVGGVSEQLGKAGVLVPPGDLPAFANAILDLLLDPDRRAELGDAAAHRVRARFDVRGFRTAIHAVMIRATRLHSTPATGSTLRFESRDASARKVFVLKSFDAAHELMPDGHRWRLRYGIDAITEEGFDLELSDAVHRPPWTLRPVRTAVRRLEALGAPILQTLLAAHAIGASDATIAIFESQGNALAALRALRIPPFTRPTYAVVECWLARDLARFGPVRRFLYRHAYRSVDLLFCFSANQKEILSAGLDIPIDRVRFVPFGVDHELFAPETDDDDGYVLAVGRDTGRDWPTFLAAVGDLDLPVKLASRAGAVSGLAVPRNVELLGFVESRALPRPARARHRRRRRDEGPRLPDRPDRCARGHVHGPMLHRHRHSRDARLRPRRHERFDRPSGRRRRAAGRDHPRISRSGPPPIDRNGRAPECGGALQRRGDVAPHRFRGGRGRGAPGAVLANQPAQQLMSARLCVLCYHHVLGTWAFPSEPDHAKRGFEEQMRTLARYANVVGLGNLLERLRDGRTLPPRAVAITFDDGYYDNLSVAAPVLRTLGMPATFFLSPGFLARSVIPWWEQLAAAVLLSRARTVDYEGSTIVLTDRIERYRSYRRVSRSLKRVDRVTRDKRIGELLDVLMPGAAPDPSSLFLDWDGARQLVADGFEIGAHSIAHPILSREAPEEQLRELAESRTSLTDALGVDVELFAYPNGTRADYNAATLSAAEKAGYRGAATCRFGWNTAATPALEVRRLMIDPSSGRRGLVQSVARPIRAGASTQVAAWLRRRRP